MKTKRVLPLLGLVATMLFAPARSFATDLTYDNGALGATVKFVASGSNLIVTLTNGAIDNPFNASQILTGVFFDIVGDPELVPVSAVICAGCSVTAGGGTDAGGGVGGEWAYKFVSDGGLLHANSFGISAVSVGGFGTKNLFGGSNLFGSASPSGVDYGITTTGDSSGNDKTGLLNVPVIVNQVIFTLKGLPTGFDPSTAIANPNFNYGTTESSTPEPASLALLGFGAVTALVARRRRKQSA